MKKTIIVLLILFISVSIAQEKYHRAKIYYKNPDTFLKLMEEGVPMDHGHRGNDNSFESDFSDSQLKIVKKLGINYDIVIEDLQQYYLDQNNPKSSRYVGNETNLKEEFNCEYLNKGGDKFATPKNFNQGSMGGYLTYSEMLQELDDMYSYCQENGIDIITKRADNINPDNPNDLKTEEGRYQQWVKISDNASKDEKDSEPQMLYTAIHHAREAMSLQQLIFYMWYLIENYKTNPEIKALVDNTEIFFIPCLNPDGYLYNEKTDPDGGGMWRKNRRGGYGVDNNRNYSYITPEGKETWGTSGISKNKTKDTYCGTAPFSEPENRAMRYFIEKHEFVININNHSYSDLVLIPFGYVVNKPTPDHDLYLALSDEMVIENEYKNQLSSELYPASGVSDDFIYGNLKTANGGTRKKVIVMTPEIGGQDDGSFWPPKSKIEPIAKEMMHLNLTALRAARNYAILDDESSFFTNTTAFNFKYSLKRIGVQDGNFKVSIEPVSSNIESVGKTQITENLKYGETKTKEIAINLKANIKEGDNFTFKVHSDNGKYTTTKTITKVFGTPNIVFQDNASDVNNWTSESWKTTTNEFKSSPSCITDSPNGKYKSNTTSYIELKEENAFNLTDKSISSAILTFYAKWDIEERYDYTQLEASTDGTTWTPLCGKYSSTGRKAQKGAIGEPVYDGKSDWVKETINLSDYLGKKVRLRFSLVSGKRTNADGFYFDDLKVVTLGNTLSNTKNTLDKFITVYPNPVKNKLIIRTTLNNYNYKLSTIQGQLLINSNSNKDSNTIDYSNYPQGVYLLNITSNGKQKTFKIVKQ